MTREVTYVWVSSPCYHCAVGSSVPTRLIPPPPESKVAPEHYVDRMFFYAWDLWGNQDIASELIPGIQVSYRNRFADAVYDLIKGDVLLEDALVSAYGLGLTTTERADLVIAWVKKRTKR